MLLAILAVILVDSKTKKIVKSQHITRLPRKTENIYWYLKEKNLLRKQKTDAADQCQEANPIGAQAMFKFYIY